MKKLPLSLVLVGIWAPAVCAAEPEPPRGEPAPPPPDSPWHNRQHQSPDGWKKADSDGDGFISRAEFGAMPRLENLPADKQDALFKRLDKDGNGSLSREELDRLFKPQDPRRPMFPRLAELDTDKNGSISLAEFKAGEIFKKLPPEGQDELFRRLDADGDGAITPKDSPLRTRPGGPTSPHDPRWLFRELDKNADGGLTVEEFKQAPWVRELPPDEQQRRFDSLDANKDKQIDGPEFSKLEPKGGGRGEGKPRPGEPRPSEPPSGEARPSEPRKTDG